MGPAMRCLLLGALCATVVAMWTTNWLVVVEAFFVGQLTGLLIEAFTHFVYLMTCRKR